MTGIGVVRGFATLLGWALIPAALLAQSGGQVTGKVLDSEGRLPLGGARVAVVGTEKFATTTVDGRFSMRGVSAGAITLRATMIGYTPKTITGVVVTDAHVTTQDITLSQKTVELQEITVTAAAEQGTVNSALDEQRNSIGIVNAISQEQIARSPDADAAGAVQRVSGATVQDGKYVFVRGLGDRYTQASLNGARIPSPEPERKVIPLDLFPTRLLEAISISKTFTPDQPGDFAGASVNLRTRDYSGKSFVSMSVVTGFNDAVAGKPTYFAPSTSLDFVAFGSTPRAIPADLANANFSQQLPNHEENSLIASMRNVWSPQAREGSANIGGGITVGGLLPTKKANISYLLSGTYASAQEAKADQRRALAQVGSSGEAEEVDRYDGSTGRSTVLWGGVANFGATLGAQSKLTLNTTYNRTMDNDGRFEVGTSENLALPLEIVRLRYVERNLGSGQLAMHQQFGGRHLVDYGVTYSTVARKEPDRSEFVDDRTSTIPTWFGFSNEGAVRTFADLSEHSVEANANWQFYLGDAGGGRSIKVGGLYRSTDRTAENTSYSVSMVRPLSDTITSMAPEVIFDGRLTDGSDDNLRLVPLAAGGSYTASDQLAAGYVMGTIALSRSLELVAGARIEHSAVVVQSRSTAGEPSTAMPEYTDALPAIALNLKVGERSNLRLSATRTLSRPEYRELSPILFREVIGFDNIKGNPALRRATIQNYDFRWEMYPGKGEVVSFGVFAKRFTDPIERVYQGTSGTRIITYVNALGADNYGVEVEFRKRLGSLGAAMRNFDFFTNATLMKSSIQIDPSTGSITNANRKMVGQSPYVVNAGLGWTHPNGFTSATLLFNRMGNRITEAGETPLPDVVEQARNVLDLSFRIPVAGAMGARFDAKNLLDAPYQTLQGSVIREAYHGGRVFAIGLTWNQ